MFQHCSMKYPVRLSKTPSKVLLLKLIQVSNPGQGILNFLPNLIVYIYRENYMNFGKWMVVFNKSFNIYSNHFSILSEL